MRNLLKYKYTSFPLFFYFCVFFSLSACGASKGENAELQESYNIAVELKDEKKLMESNKLFHKIIDSPDVTDDLKIKSICKFNEDKCPIAIEFTSARISSLVIFPLCLL